MSCPRPYIKQNWRKMTVTIIVFTLNEIEGVRVTLPRIKKEWYDQIIIVDGGSTDGTIEYAQQQGFDVFVQSKPGISTAFREALSRCTSDIVVMFAPDGNSVPEDIPALVNTVSQGYDIAIGSRYYNGAKSADDDLITSFGNWMFTTLFNVLFGTRIKDVLNMYRAYRVDMLKKLDISTDLDSWGTQILAQAVRLRYKYIEIPSEEPKRIGGTRKMQPLKNGWMELKTILFEFFRK